MRTCFLCPFHSAGFVAAVPYLAMAVVVQLGGHLADGLRRRGILSTTATRKATTSGGEGREEFGVMSLTPYKPNLRAPKNCKHPSTNRQVTSTSPVALNLEALDSLIDPIKGQLRHYQDHFNRASYSLPKLDRRELVGAEERENNNHG